MARNPDGVDRVPDPDRAAVRHPSIRPAARCGRPLHLRGVPRVRHRGGRGSDAGVAGVPDRSFEAVPGDGDRNGDRTDPGQLERTELAAGAGVAQWCHALGMGRTDLTGLARRPEQSRVGVGEGRGARTGRGPRASRDRCVAEQPDRAPDARPDSRGRGTIRGGGGDTAPGGRDRAPLAGRADRSRLRPLRVRRDRLCGCAPRARGQAQPGRATRPRVSRPGPCQGRPPPGGGAAPPARRRAEPPAVAA